MYVKINTFSSAIKKYIQYEINIAKTYLIYKNFNINKILEAGNMCIQNYSSFYHVVLDLCLKDYTKCSLFYKFKK